MRQMGLAAVPSGVRTPHERERCTMAKAKKVDTRWSAGSTDIDELPPRERLAHEIVSAHGDLLPSVERIMSADLTEEQGLVALTAFRDSINVAGDPNRDPRVSIANAAG
jgi:hypothetical protein